MKRKALFVGINDYEGGLVPLNCACKDANDLCDYFRDVLRYDTYVLRNADILEVRKKINEVTKDLQRGDVFLFFFAGHGFTVDKGENIDRRLATARDPKDHLEDGEGGISLRRLRRLTKGGYSRVFILDACQTKINAIRAADEVEKKTLSKRDLSIISSIVKTTNEVDDVAPLWVINSCNIGDVAYELENNGLFTWAFIETLMGLRESGEAPVFNETLVSNIANKMRMHPGRFNQTPVFFASDEETPAISVFGDAFSSVDVASMSVSSLVLCPICGKKNKIEDTFKCRQCGRDNLCLRHQDEKMFLCTECIASHDERIIKYESTQVSKESNHINKIIILGYSEWYAICPKIRVFIDGKEVGLVSRNGKLVLSVKKECIEVAVEYATVFRNRSTPVLFKCRDGELLLRIKTDRWAGALSIEEYHN